ncbi:N-acetylglucosamine kinase [Kocuria sp.]|uniref:N-acetylglucosamine kinase n=1 Tax=Kocuria sp. TaxID=1871328 RepID=UPI0026DF0374|nr:BadF/BadG/BcrA/BcrD ATPase family protein [Kocuria sp.]MDO5619188.1 BadF/BadG/BcrA/BcrD ATPase family protein [Kocuria sp.]
MKQLLFGLDIGGTSTHGIRAERGEAGWVVTDQFQGPSANVQNVSHAAAQQSLLTVATRLGFDTTSPGHLRVVAGAGGMDTPADADALRAMITRAVPAAGVTGSEITVVHDTRLILAAGGQDTGVAVIAGTGSVAWGRAADGREARSGGWGHLLGDEGSSWWIAREAVRRALRRQDAQDPVDELDRAVLQARNVQTRDQLIADFHGHPERTDWAALAQVVDRCATGGHTDSSDLLVRATRHLVAAARTVADQLDLPGPVVVGGGLIAHSHHIHTAFVEQATAAGLEEVMVLGVDPVMGVLHLAAD